MSEPIRWLPRHGEPHLVIEMITQACVKLLANLPVYAGIVAMLTIVIVAVTK